MPYVSSNPPARRTPGRIRRGELDSKPCNQDEQHQNRVGKSASNDEVNKRRRPEESPFASPGIESARGTPPRPGQPCKGAKRAEPIRRAPADNPTVERRDQRDDNRQRN